MKGDFILEILRGSIKSGINRFKSDTVKRSLAGEEVTDDMALLTSIEKIRYEKFNSIESKIYRMINIMKSPMTKYRIEGMLYSLCILYNIPTSEIDSLINFKDFDDKDALREIVRKILVVVRERL